MTSRFATILAIVLACLHALADLGPERAGQPVVISDASRLTGHADHWANATHLETGGGRQRTWSAMTGDTDFFHLILAADFSSRLQAGRCRQDLTVTLLSCMHRANSGQNHCFELPFSIREPEGPGGCEL